MPKPLRELHTQNPGTTIPKTFGRATIPKIIGRATCPELGVQQIWNPRIREPLAPDAYLWATICWTLGSRSRPFNGWMGRDFGPRFVGRLGGAVVWWFSQFVIFVLNYRFHVHFHCHASIFFSSCSYPIPISSYSSTSLIQAN